MCDCHSHGLVVERFDDEEEVYIALFERGLDGRKLSFIERIKWCWQILRYGNPWNDLIVLNKEKQKELAEFLNH
jgi:hypothetical protein